MPTAALSNARVHLELATRITCAYVSRSHIAPAELTALLAITHNAIRGLASATVAAGTDQPAATEIEKSIRPDGLVSFLDGRAYKTLKRHLTSHGLDPKSYRVRYGLPADYPMVAEAYRARRSALATRIGLGRGGLIPEIEGR